MNRRLMSQVSYGLSAALVVSIGSPLWAQSEEGIDDPPTNAEVINMEVLNLDDLRQRDIQVDPSFVLAPGGHFQIATLNLVENLGPDSPDGTTDPTRPGEIIWWDLEIEVFRNPNDTTGQGVMISIDKDVINNTNYHWTDFHISVGTGVGPNFVESNEFDALYFKTNPAPINEQPILPVPNPIMAFDNPPMLDEPVAPDSLWWFADQKPGLWPGQTTAFWLGINVPASFFPPGANSTLITVREHASIPEPASVALLTLGALLLPLRRN